MTGVFGCRVEAADRSVGSASDTGSDQPGSGFFAQAGAIWAASQTMGFMSGIKPQTPISRLRLAEHNLLRIRG
jgi:hypothetical protein